jgi:DNA repair exonuclease SbcCD ATPase subunit
VIGAYQHLHLEEYDHQVSAKKRLIQDIQKGNRELLQENHRLEARVKELNDELMRTYHSCDVKLDFLNDARTRLKNAQDESIAAQGYIHHLETELHERDEQLEVSQAQAAEYLLPLSCWFAAIKFRFAPFVNIYLSAAIMSIYSVDARFCNSTLPFHKKEDR